MRLSTLIIEPSAKFVKRKTYLYRNIEKNSTNVNDEVGTLAQQAKGSSARNDSTVRERAMDTCRRHTTTCLVLAVLLMLSACARFPETGQMVSKRLIVQFRVAGQIRPDYYYFILIDNDTDPLGVSGPVAPVAPPWGGNGFATGSFQRFVEYNGALPFSGFLLYRVLDPDRLQVFQPMGPPLEASISPDRKTIRVVVDFASLALDGQDPADIRVLQVNIIATDRTPKDPTDTSLKMWDALGDSRQSPSTYLTLLTDTDRILRNTDTGMEPEGDVVNGNDPDLDIVDWQIEVRS